MIIESSLKVRKAIPKIESNFKVKVNISPKKVVIKGDELNEFIVENILHAVDFGFDIADALLLKNEHFVLEFMSVKEHTKRGNLEEVRGRVIGTDGKAKRTIEELTGSALFIKGNTIGIIVDSDHLESCVQALSSLIHGAKHSNVFSYLERKNTDLRKVDKGDLGLKAGMENLDDE